MMVAEEWIQRTFGVYRYRETEEDPGVLRFTAARAGDFERWLPHDPGRVLSVEADLDAFLTHFGAIINTALSLAENPVDHLVGLPFEAQRGWGAVFRLWRAREI